MKPLAEQDHYEVLDVPRDASPEDIERAYRVAQATYADDSLALYSVFDGDDAEALRQRVETAYSVLSSREGRRAYDAWLGGDTVPAAAFAPIAPDAPAPAFERVIAAAEEPPRAEAPPPEPRRLPPLEAFPRSPLEGVDEDEASPEYDGTRLRRTRLRRGIELEQIAAITKINPTYLRFLEEERFDDLPAAVYVRGFVVAYLRCVGIDPAKGAASYMARFEAGRAARKKGRSPATG